jgi:DNA-binding PadR family transcriptional regulator
MGSSPAHLPSYQERAAMEAVRGDRNYQATPRMLLKLLRKGWIEKRGVAGEDREYQLTLAGSEALRAKVQT